MQTGKKTLGKLANYLKTHTDNHVFPKISVCELEGKKIIVVEVSESKEKPVFFKGRAYARVGASRHKLSASEIRKLAKESGEKTYWDSLACEGAGLEDIDWEFIGGTFIPLYEDASKKKTAGTTMDLLQSLGCVKNKQPTNAGILLFGKEPQKFVMNAYIALARYKGKAIGGEKLDYKEFGGNSFSR